MPVNWLKLMSFVVRRGGRGAHRHALRRAERERLPAHLLLRAADHRLHDGDPRRLRQPGRASCSARSSSASLLELLRDPGKSRLIFVVALRRRARRSRSASRRSSRSSPRSTLVFGFALHAIARAHHAAWVAGEHGRRLRRRRRALGRRRRRTSRAGSRPSRTSALIARASSSDAAARPRVRLVLLIADALSRGVRLGERDAREARAGAVHRARADPDRADDPAAERPARRAPRGDHLMPLLELNGVSLAFGGLKVVDGPRPARRRGRDRLGDRPERRRQDDALQPDHRHLRPGRGRHHARRPEHRRARSRTRSASAASRARSRRCASS